MYMFLGVPSFRLLKYHRILAPFTALQCSAGCTCCFLTRGRADGQILQVTHWLGISTSYNPTSKSLKTLCWVFFKFLWNILDPGWEQVDQDNIFCILKLASSTFLKSSALLRCFSVGYFEFNEKALHEDQLIMVLLLWRSFETALHWLDT